MVPRAHFGSIPIGRVEISIDEPRFRWMREHGTLHVPDVRAQNDFPILGSAGDWRTFLSVPLRQQGEFVGTLNARRIEVRPFTPAQIKLLETFADQAVIAIENVRLFQELKEVVGAANGDERNSWRHRQLADGYPARAGCRCGKRRAAVRCQRRIDSTRSRAIVFDQWRITDRFRKLREDKRTIDRGYACGPSDR